MDLRLPEISADILFTFRNEEIIEDTILFHLFYLIFTKGTRLQSTLIREIEDLTIGVATLFENFTRFRRTMFFAESFRAGTFRNFHCEIDDGITFSMKLIFMFIEDVFDIIEIFGEDADFRFIYVFSRDRRFIGNATVYVDVRFTIRTCAYATIFICIENTDITIPHITVPIDGMIFSLHVFHENTFEIYLFNVFGFIDDHLIENITEPYIHVPCRKRIETAVCKKICYRMTNAAKMCSGFMMNIYKTPPFSIIFIGSRDNTRELQIIIDIFGTRNETVSEDMKMR